MKTYSNSLLFLSVCATLLILSACNNDDDGSPEPEGPATTGEEVVYNLAAIGNSGISGTATFAELEDNSTLITLNLTGTSSGGDHPTHIHINSAAEGGSIAMDLNNVEGGTGLSETVITETNDGTEITYEQLIAFDGYINVHSSAEDLATLLAQGDIGSNVLTGESVSYELTSVSDPGISGQAVFSERASGETLITVSLTGTADGSDHPSHVHMNSAAEGGGIVLDLSNVADGTAKTHVAALNDGTPITYDELLDLDGYINVHNSSSDLGTLVAQGDIGQNELTGDEKVYELTPVADPAVTGTATFAKRKSGEILVTVALDGTTPGASHPSHIHANTIAEGGGIVIDLNNVDGTTGMARTSVDTLRDGTAITYEELLDFDGYLNVHTGSTFVVQGDIGQNELTGESETYELMAVGGSGISGTAIFSERLNGETLVVIQLTGDDPDSDRPSHIHTGSVDNPGGIAIDLSNVKAGFSQTNVVNFRETVNDGAPITYDELIQYNGYINVHKSTTELATLVAQGNMGSNGG